MLRRLPATLTDCAFGIAARASRETLPTENDLGNCIGNVDINNVDLYLSARLKHLRIQPKENVAAGDPSITATINVRAHYLR
jgi:hypothetical protein